MARAPVQPDLIRWARERSGRSVDELARRFKKLPEWERGEVQPTFRQLEEFAKATHVPLGFLFLPERPEERIPIPDLRTVSNLQLRHPSPELLDTLYAMQRRQAWLREELIDCEAEPLDFVSSARVTDDPEAVGREMRRIIGLEDEWAAAVRTWREAVSELRQAFEEQGIIAVINGVVGNNTHRKLRVEEFRGFALCDSYAPLVFVNGADAKSAQMFTLAHELAHLWLGESALTNAGLAVRSSHEIETWCDRAAAEFLVPRRLLKDVWPTVRRADRPFEALARRFKVSPIVTARRAMDLRLIERDEFFAFYEEYMARERNRRTSSGGGDFYHNQNTRVGKRFAMQVILAAKEGRIGFAEAYDLTGLRGGAFQEYAKRLGVRLP